jgi:2-keto-4-pentenoate hydratase/2-oxohepta-3-ene-1,7-dioic acid hydratase in catechol pathway
VRIARARLAGHSSYGLVDGDRFQPITGDPFGKFRAEGAAVPLDLVEPLSSTDPRTVMVMLGGFRRAETETVDHPPRLAFKGIGVEPSGDGGAVVYPPLATAPLSAESELAVVIGRTARSVPVEHAWSVIAGFTVMNDVTAFEFLQTSGLPTDRASGIAVAKAFDTFCSLGPWIETEINDEMIRKGLTICTRVNGEERQRGTTRLFKFPVGEVVSFASQVMTLHPGDVISLGTPMYVEVHHGDAVESEVEGVGVLRNTFMPPQGEPVAEERRGPD